MFGERVARIAAAARPRWNMLRVDKFLQWILPGILSRRRAQNNKLTPEGKLASGPHGIDLYSG